MVSLDSKYVYYVDVLGLVEMYLVICSSIFCMLMLAGMCSGVYVMLSFIIVMRPASALWLLSCQSVV